MQPDRLTHHTAQPSALRVNRPICPDCGSDELLEVLLCTPQGNGWRECVDCGWKVNHTSDCAICRNALNYPAAYRAGQASAQRVRRQNLHHLRWADTVSDPSGDNDEVRDDPHAGVKFTVISLVALLALIGLSWLVTHPR